MVKVRLLEDEGHAQTEEGEVQTMAVQQKELASKSIRPHSLNPCLRYNLSPVDVAATTRGI